MSDLIDPEPIIEQLTLMIETLDAETRRFLPLSVGRATTLARMAALDDAIQVVRDAPRVAKGER
jgi:hypothetical protein